MRLCVRTVVRPKSCKYVLDHSRPDTSPSRSRSFLARGRKLATHEKGFFAASSIKVHNKSRTRDNERRLFGDGGEMTTATAVNRKR